MFEKSPISLREIANRDYDAIQRLFADLGQWLAAWPQEGGDLSWMEIKRLQGLADAKRMSDNSNTVVEGEVVDAALPAMRGVAGGCSLGVAPA